MKLEDDSVALGDAVEDFYMEVIIRDVDSDNLIAVAFGREIVCKGGVAQIFIKDGKVRVL